MNKYDFVEKHGSYFSFMVGCDEDISKLLSAHGGKSSEYEYLFEERGLHKGYCLLVYLLTYVKPYSNHVRETKDGWVSVDKFIESALNDCRIKFALEEIKKLERLLETKPINYSGE